MAVDGLEEVGDGDGLGAGGGGHEGGAVGGHHTGVGHGHAVGLGELQVLEEHVPELGQEGEGAAAEEYRRLHIDAAGEGAQDLQADGVEDGQRDIGLADVAGQQVLDVGLGEDAAARRDGIDVLGFLGQGVQLGGVDVQQAGGLVDEGAGAARAVAVHADVGHPALVEEDHLAVLAPDVNEGAGLREGLLDERGGGDDLLHEGEAPKLGVAHAHAAGDGHAAGADAFSVGKQRDAGSVTPCCDAGSVAS